MKRRFRLLDGVGIRTKLLLVTLVLLAIPLVGVSYVREMERFLRDGQEQSAIAIARAAATALHDRPSCSSCAPGRRPREPRSARAGAIRPTHGAPALRIPRSPKASARRRSRDAARIGRRVTPEATREIELIMRGLARAQSRIWVIDQQRRLLALTGRSSRSRMNRPVPRAARRSLLGARSRRPCCARSTRDCSSPPSRGLRRCAARDCALDRARSRSRARRRARPRAGATPPTSAS